MKQSEKSRDKVTLKLYSMDSTSKIRKVFRQVIQSWDWNVWLGKSDTHKVLSDVRADVGLVPDLCMHTASQQPTKRKACTYSITTNDTSFATKPICMTYCYKEST